MYVIISSKGTWSGRADQAYILLAWLMLWSLGNGAFHMPTLPFSTWDSFGKCLLHRRLWLQGPLSRLKRYAWIPWYQSDLLNLLERLWWLLMPMLLCLLLRVDVCVSAYACNIMLLLLLRVLCYSLCILIMMCWLRSYIKWTLFLFCKWCCHSSASTCVYCVSAAWTGGNFDLENLFPWLPLRGSMPWMSQRAYGDVEMWSLTLASVVPLRQGKTNPVSWGIKFMRSWDPKQELGKRTGRV